MAARGIAIDLSAFASGGVLSTNVKVSCWVPSSAGAKTSTPRVFYSDPALATPATQGGTFGDTSGRRVIYLNPTTATVVEVESTNEATAYADLYVPAMAVLGDIGGTVPMIVANNAALTALTSATGLINDGVYRTLGGSTERDGLQADWIYDSASTATAGDSVLAIDGGGAGRFYKWRATAFSMDDFAGDTDTAKLIAALAYVDNLAGGATVRVTRSFTLTTGVTVPQKCTLDCCGFRITKGANIDMITLADQAMLVNAYINGAGATYTGRCVVVSAGNNQRMINVDIIDMNGYNLEFTVDLVGSNFAWIGGSFNRTTSTNDAIKLFGPTAETSTGGGRRFIALAGNGSAMIDFSGGNLTYIIGCTAASVTFGDNCANVVIDDSSRIAQSPTIKGSSHKLDAIWTASPTITLASGANSCRLNIQSGATVTDSSGVTSNEIVHWNGRHYTDTGLIKVIGQSADSKTLVQFKSGANNRATHALDASGHFQIATQNSKEIHLGIGTADDLKILASSIEPSLSVLPAVTESIDLGSAAREWNNIYSQNAVTVSDMRRKREKDVANLTDEHGVIDGDQALALVNELTPRTFAFLDRVIPAHTKTINEEYEEEEDYHFAETDADGVEQRRVVKRMVQKVRPVEVDVPEQVIPHARPHAGFYAQEVKEALTRAGIEDLGAYAYSPENDTHELRMFEFIAVLVAGMQRLSARVAELEGGPKPTPVAPADPPSTDEGKADGSGESQVSNELNNINSIQAPPVRDEPSAVPSAPERAEEEVGRLDDGIPDAFRGLMLVDESPEKFTERMRRRWNALQQYRIDGSKPTAARALPDMTEEEDAELRDLEERNRQHKWLD